MPQPTPTKSSQLFYQPVSPWVINQHFGEDETCVSKDGKQFVHKETHQTCPAGYKSVYSQMKGHNGLDVRAYRWQPVYAAREGRVVEVETETERGLGVGVLHGPYDGKYYKTRYWHLIAMDVLVGDTVKTGTLLGYADSTGYSTGDHLHFEVKQTDSKGNTLNNSNGDFGAIDPAPLTFPKFARDVHTLNGLVEQLAVLVDKLADALRNKK